MTNYRQQLGLKGERLALEFLLSLGCLLVEQRFRIQEGEADLIVLDHKQLVFVEVKTRTSLNGRFGAPIESKEKTKLLSFRAYKKQSFPIIGKSHGLSLLVIQ